MVGLDEQRRSMLLELYCRKAERKRKGRKGEVGHGHMERGEKGKKERKKKGREKERKTGRK